MHNGRERFDNKGNGLLVEDITRKEVMWALRKLKVKATAGKDGITVEMINGEVLVELWWELFSCCWSSGMVPSVWRSVVVPVLERIKRVCRKDNFRGISLVSVVYKAMCLIVQERLVQEDRELLEKEQGGFRRGRGCRDQILSLARLGQTMITKRRIGILAAFIDFKNAYDRVDRSKLWSCLEGAGLGRLVEFLKAA